MNAAVSPLPNAMDPDDVEHLGERIAELAAQITAATFRALDLGWAVYGLRSLGG